MRLRLSCRLRGNRLRQSLWHGRLWISTRIDVIVPLRTTLIVPVEAKTAHLYCPNAATAFRTGLTFIHLYCLYRVRRGYSAETMSTRPSVVGITRTPFRRKPYQNSLYCTMPIALAYFALHCSSPVGSRALLQPAARAIVISKPGRFVSGPYRFASPATLKTPRRWHRSQTISSFSVLTSDSR